MVEKMELDETGFPQPTGELEELEADSLVLALGQEADLSLLDGVPGLEVDDGVVKVGPNMMTGLPGDLRRRRHGPRRAHRDGRRSATARRPRAHIDAWLRGERLRARRRSTSSPTFEQLNTWYYSDAPRTRAAAARARAPAVDFRGGRRRARRVDGAVRGPPLPVVRQLLLLRQLLRRLPRQRGASSSATRASRTRSTRLLQGLRHLRRGVPVRRDRDGARDDLTRSARRASPPLTRARAPSTPSC